MGLKLTKEQVTFISNAQWQPPMHPHVYSNGHICASILGELPLSTPLAPFR